LYRSILVYKNTCFSIKKKSKIPSSHLFSSYDVIGSFFKWKPPIFFLDSDSPFNCLNDSIKILLSYIRKFLRKKIIKLEKINFITNKNKSKNQVGQSNSQMLLSISFVCVICFTKPRPPRFIRDSSLIRPAAFVVLSIIFVL
jgi:hypothetical protein